ncbi:hypothetical protein ACLMJK_000222 [Lecanora helva]
MVHHTALPCIAALLLLEIIPFAVSHGGDHGEGAAIIQTAKFTHMSSSTNVTNDAEQSYFAYPHYMGLMLGHIGLMTVAWCFVLPVGVMLSVGRSRLAVLVQLSFLCLHSIGLLLGVIYTGKTPKLYESNVHGKIGWIVTWLVLLQCVTGLVKLATSFTLPKPKEDEQRPFLPITTEALERYEEAQPYRYSNDSGHFTASDISRSQSISSTREHNEEAEQRKLREYYDSHVDAEANCIGKKNGLFINDKIQKFASYMSARFSNRTLRVLNTFHNIIDCTSLPFGFVAILSGAVVYGGIFHGRNIFNGLAHSIKGGIFFWYGLLTLGRWMGCFAEMGWAWNVRPPVGVVTPRKVRIPSAEFVESLVIFLYGASNVWLEHLAAWGSAWSAQDFEHVSISIMFFGGGLCGMLVESRRVRDFLNTAIVTSPAAYGPPNTRELLMPPKTYAHSMNPFPALIILLLGLMMSSHHQSSMVSTTVHKQWGMLFVGFALARAVTYILMYISPPTSYLPSRPPSELISSFCLISGGLIFIASNRDTVSAMEHHGLHAMFPFTVTMGFTAFLMAWAVIVLAVKGWAAGRQVGSDSLSGRN